VAVSLLTIRSVKRFHRWRDKLVTLRAGNPEVRREQILEEAISILGRLGYHGFTIHELAERCGLSNAGLLYHFPSKDQLFCRSRAGA